MRMVKYLFRSFSRVSADDAFTRCWLMLGRRRRRRPSISPASGQCLTFTGSFNRSLSDPCITWHKQNVHIACSHTINITGGLNPRPAESFTSIFRHLKLELLTQYPASNDEKIFVFMINRHILNCII